MFEKVLSKNAKQSLAILSKSGILKSAYLAGGTALALHLGHRYSYDFDFFTPQKFDEEILVQQIKEALILYDKKFRSLRQNKIHVLKSLVYFGDAEKDKLPQMIKKVTWSSVKKFFISEQHKIAKEILEI